MNKYWMLVASKNHVLTGVKEGFAQACHGKALPLFRMQPGDGIIYYSPKIEFEKKLVCQEFTAIGFVLDEKVYLHDMGNGFIPYRRNIHYLKSQAIQIKPLISQLNFIKDKNNWGYQFRFGSFEIIEADFNLVAEEMQAIYFE